jgi:hypothetical protein
MKWIPLAVTLAGTVGAAIFTPAFLSAHPLAFTWIGGAAQVIHALLPSVTE